MISNKGFDKLKGKVNESSQPEHSRDGSGSNDELRRWWQNPARDLEFYPSPVRASFDVPPNPAPTRDTRALYTSAFERVLQSSQSREGVYGPGGGGRSDTMPLFSDSKYRPQERSRTLPEGYALKQAEEIEATRKTIGELTWQGKVLESSIADLKGKLRNAHIAKEWGQEKLER